MPALSASRLARLLHRLAHLALLASLGVLALLPAFDHHAAEYSPWHSHLTLAEADLPDHHPHPYAQPHTHPALGSAPAADIVFTPNPLSGVVSLLAAFDQVLPPAWLAVLPLLALWFVFAAPRLTPRPNLLPFPDPPPRPALG